VPANGVHLHVVEAGPQDGRPVVLLHGFPEFWYGWRHQIPALAEAGFRVIVPDQRGYNRSAKPASVAAYDIDALVGDIVALLDAYGLERSHVVGHDWGAVVAWVLAMRHPESLHQLVVANVPHPAVFRETLGTSWEQVQRSWYIFFFQIPRLPEWWLGRNDGANLARMLRGSAHADTFTAEDLPAYRRAWQRPQAVRSMVHWYRAAARRALRGGLPKDRIEVPTLVVWGAQDVALSRQMARPSAERCRDGELVVIEKATHWVQHDASDRVNDLLLQRLRP
jgi:pimeloyl-ACP methyl ester carboxylesterase